MQDLSIAEQAVCNFSIHIDYDENNLASELVERVALCGAVSCRTLKTKHLQTLPHRM